MEKNVWLYFCTEADDDNISSTSNCMFPASSLVGAVPSANGTTQLQFKSMRNHNSAVTDTVTLDLLTNNTHLDIMKTIVRAINDTRPTFGGFKIIADDLNRYVDNTVLTTEAFGHYPSYVTDGTQEAGKIRRCDAIDLVAATNGTITATADGTGTAVIPSGGFWTVSSGNAAHWVTLPAPIPGTIVYLNTAADSTGFEIRSTAPASIGINAGTGSNAESDIAGGVDLVRLVCVSATNWVGTQYVSAGTEAAITAAG